MTTSTNNIENENGNGSKDRDINYYLRMIERLRDTEEFSVRTNERLERHPYLEAAKSGNLTLRQRRAFVGEQYFIQGSDALSFATLAGHNDTDFIIPHASLSSVSEVPEPPPSSSSDGSSSPDAAEQQINNNNSSKSSKNGNTPDLFQFLLGGEVYASKLLLDHAESVGFSNVRDSDGNENLQSSELRYFPVTGRGQAYPSYWSRLALRKDRGIGAAAVAVNFPAWGRMCRQLLEALRDRPEYGYSNLLEEESKKELAFIEFFATPIEHLDEMAAKIMMEEHVEYNQELRTSVRLLQEYEVLFWDAIYDAA